MFSQFDMPSNEVGSSEKAANGKGPEEMRGKSSSARTYLKPVVLAVFTVFMVSIFTWQTVYLVRVSNRLSLVEEAVPTSSTWLASDDTEIEETFKSKRSVPDGDSVRHNRQQNQSGRQNSRRYMTSRTVPSVHLVANTKSNDPIEAENFVRWRNASSVLRHSYLPVIDDTFVRIVTSGFYNVYAQLTMEIDEADRMHAKKYGFQVTKSDRITGVHTPLLTARGVLFKIGGVGGSLQAGVETKHTSGQFFLCRGQEIGVRADPTFKLGLILVSDVNTIDSSSFLGLWKIKNAYYADEENRYCS
ncbi:uncharacterized protein [Antedon mediterranea]|uniref:uncharacterized protein n=1 Tax=Antedon mediterranea TaxID=105859 RepID=UPI003AF7393A